MLLQASAKKQVDTENFCKENKGKRTISEGRARTSRFLLFSLGIYAIIRLVDGRTWCQMIMLGQSAVCIKYRIIPCKIEVNVVWTGTPMTTHNRGSRTSTQQFTRFIVSTGICPIDSDDIWIWAIWIWAIGITVRKCYTQMTSLRVDLIYSWYCNF